MGGPAAGMGWAWDALRAGRTGHGQGHRPPSLGSKQTAPGLPGLPGPSCAAAARPQRTHKGPDHRPDFAQVRLQAAAYAPLETTPSSPGPELFHRCRAALLHRALRPNVRDAVSRRAVGGAVCRCCCCCCSPSRRRRRCRRGRAAAAVVEAHACMRPAALRSLAPPPGTSSTTGRRCL